MCTSKPSKPKAPPPPPPPPAPIKYADETQAKARSKERRRATQATGPASTVLTSQQGDTSTALTGKTKLGA